VSRSRRIAHRSLIHARMSFSPEMREAGLSSCFGRLDEKESRWVRRRLPAPVSSPA
jgi:hypothetical protein